MCQVRPVWPQLERQRTSGFERRRSIWQEIKLSVALVFAGATDFVWVALFARLALTE
jgi:hypothetical protein